MSGNSIASASADDQRLVTGLRAGDESTFSELVELHAQTMLRVACTLVSSPALAEEVVQETWLAVLTGIRRFEGRSSLRTWIFRILTNTAHTQRGRDARSVPFSDLARELSGEPAVDPERFLPQDDPRWPGHWSLPPQSWGSDPESRLLATETLEAIRCAIDALPPGQRAVVTLRDVRGWSPEEVSQALEISRGNQRVLLHRARSRIRTALEDWMGAPGAAPAPEPIREA